MLVQSHDFIVVRLHACHSPCREICGEAVATWLRQGRARQ